MPVTNWAERNRQRNEERNRRRNQNDSDRNRRNNGAPHKGRKNSTGDRRKSPGGSVNRLLNPPFDPRMRNIGGPLFGHVERGWMVMAEEHPDTKLRHRVNFMYNPQTVNVNHALQMGYSLTAAPEASPTTGPGAMYGFGGLDVGLLFDRTYELWDGSKENTLAGRFGVYVDVMAFYIYLGIIRTEVEQDPAGGGMNRGGAGSGMTFPGSIPEGPGGGGARRTADRHVWSSVFPNSYMFPVPSYLYIGDKLRYYGRPSGFNVQYTHWSRHMVPQRAVINLSFSLDADPHENMDKRVGRGKLRNTDPNGKPGGDSPNNPGGGGGGRPNDPNGGAPPSRPGGVPINPGPNPGGGVPLG